MPHRTRVSAQTIPRDLIAGLVVFLVALPLCLGVALASNAPLLSGIVSGIIGGILVGALSRSQTSVSGPAAGLTAVVAAQIAVLGSFEAFLTAVVLAGMIQLLLGVAKLGFLAEFVPSAVIKGLLAAIGIILILKQIPHILGRDTDPEGDMSFFQPDKENTFSELLELLGGVHPTAVMVGVASLLILITWDYFKSLKHSLVPAPLVAVAAGTAISELARSWGGGYVLESSHLVTVPVFNSLLEVRSGLPGPDFSRILDGVVLFAAVQIALVASLETLLNLEAVDKLDPRRRTSPPSRELVAQGIGNTVAGLLGGIPITSVIVRSSVNIQAGNETRMSTIAHGVYLLGSVLLLPGWLNHIPLSCLAAILLMTGFKLASPKVVDQIWRQGWSQFLPFAATVLAIVFTDLLIGVLVGLAVSVGFILHGNMRRPLRCTIERHLGGPLLRIELASHVTFLNRAALTMQLDQCLRGQHVLIDARNTHSIDLDVQDLIDDYVKSIAPARGVKVSLIGFQGRFILDDQVDEEIDLASRELQENLSPADVLQILRDGNERFYTGKRLPRDLGREVRATSDGQFPLAVVFSCIDSRSPAELIFDLGLGDIFSVRIAGHVAREKVLASMEYACAVAGTKLAIVLGHTKCGAVNAAVNMHYFPEKMHGIDCQHLDVLVREIEHSIPPQDPAPVGRVAAYADEVARRNVLHTVRKIRESSQTLDRLVRSGKLLIVGGMYDVATGRVEFLTESVGPNHAAILESAVACPCPTVEPE